MTASPADRVAELTDAQALDLVVELSQERCQQPGHECDWECSLLQRSIPVVQEAVKRAARVEELETASAAAGVLAEIAAERARQDAKWGELNHPDLDPHDMDSVVRNEYAVRADRWKEINARRAEPGCEVKYRNPAEKCTAWDGVLLEEVYEALAEADAAKLRTELIQTAAVAVAWVEAIDRRETAGGVSDVR